MIISQLEVIYVLIFGAALLAVQGLYWLLFTTRKEQKAINRRLSLSARVADPNAVLLALRRERGVDFFAANPLFQNLQELVIQSGLRLNGPRWVLAFLSPAVMFYLLLRVMIYSNIIAIALAIVLASVSVYVFLRIARKRRIAAFSEQLPDALDVIVRGLRAGHPFRVALTLVAREMPDPVGSEFGIVADEITFGLDQVAAIDNLCKRVGQDDLSFFSTAISIQQQSGGNLAEILTRLSHLLRARSKLRLKIRALSAEGRMSAVALSATPFVLIGIIQMVAPSYFAATNSSPLIVPAIALGTALLVVGNFLMYRMVNFKF